MRRAVLVLAFCVVIAIASPAQTLTTLVDFEVQNGTNPDSNLIEGTDGNFYGTTFAGGDDGSGTVFNITPEGTLTILHSFDFTDGAYPTAGLVQATDGNFYGTAQYGGDNIAGTFFKITPGGAFTTLHSFDYMEGAFPYAGVAQATDGNFYGTTLLGGADNNGTVFNITPQGILTNLHSFSFNGTDGNHPYAALVQATDGDFYGTTFYGGVNNDGTIFKITPEGILTILHSFNGTDGANPYAGLVQAADGNFYGTTEDGGANNNGTVFKITPEGTLTTLHSFEGTDGSHPQAGLVQATDGNFYGTTENGGAHLDAGTIFRITPEGTLTTLYSFCSQMGCADGRAPNAVVQATDAKFYGTTFGGGLADWGTAFRLDAGLGALLSVGKIGTGTIISGDGHIYCGSTCSYTYLSGTQVGLTALPAPGYTFSSWTGCDDVQGDICVVKMSSARNVTATFDVAQITLTSLTFNPSYVKGGRLSAATLTLSAPAPSGGLGVALSSDHPSVAHPPSFVIVPGGKTSIVFGVNTFPVKVNTTVMITATAGASQVSGTLTVGTVAAEHGVILTWTPSTGDGVTTQQIFRGLASGLEDYEHPLVEIQDNITSSYLDATAQPGTTYYYTMKACNAAGCSIASNEASNMGTSGNFKANRCACDLSRSSKNTRPQAGD